MSGLGVIGSVVAGVGLLMTITGGVMNVMDWDTARAKARRTDVNVDATSLDKNINALTSLVKALERHSPGFQLIVLGIVVLLIGAGLFTGSKFV